MAKQIFKVEHRPTFASITVEIDFDFLLKWGNANRTMNQLIVEMAEFWAKSHIRLNQNKGSHLNTFLKDLCHEIMIVAKMGNWNKDGVIDKFENREGYCRLDGTTGVKLIALEDMNLDDQDDYDITELH